MNKKLNIPILFIYLGMSNLIIIDKSSASKVITTFNALF